MDERPLVQFGVGSDGGLMLIMLEEVWSAVSEAVQTGSFEKVGGAVHVNLAKLAKLDVVRSIEIIAKTQQPPCPPIPGGDE